MSTLGLFVSYDQDVLFYGFMCVMTLIGIVKFTEDPPDFVLSIEMWWILRKERKEKEQQQNQRNNHE